MTVLILVEIILFAAFLTSDLVSKALIMPLLESRGEDIVLIDKVLTLTPAYNTGAGFSMLSGKTGWLIAITIVGLCAILFFIVYAHIKLNTKKKSTKFLLVVLNLMLAGGVGNLVDRIMYGSVRDFIDYTVVETLVHRSFAICNVADVWLTVGMVLLVVYVIFFMRDENKKESEPVADTYVVATAERLMRADKVRIVDPTQVGFREDEGDKQSDPKDDGDTAESDSTDAETDK